ncbi:MAG TPA: polyphenol oxidase family protein [Chthoniobacterales bacterium]|nr:polyphenol oxidase family protein [Chthoniobacterales bacterium]
MEPTIDHFPALDRIGICRSAFITRIPGIDVSHDKLKALEHLEAAHRKFRRELGFGTVPLATAEQIHGDRITLVDLAIGSDTELAGCDGLITNRHDVVLGIHVADCCAVYIVDRKTPAIGLVHSGKKGTALEIVIKAISEMRHCFGSDPAQLVVQLSPCIRPPHYEVDFAAAIIEQCRAAGVQQIHDSGVCTACDLDRYYSYRAEKGKTGRMLALLGLL